ncbi:MAG: TonB-dependent receptor [Myxococcota bacterium]|nr:TonB-dependent receptor [Myxococcota bacterium]
MKTTRTVGFVVAMSTLLMHSWLALAEDPASTETGDTPADTQGLIVEELPMPGEPGTSAAGNELVVGGPMVQSAVGAGQEQEFIDMSLSELLSVKVESVSKKAERTFDAPLAVSVITRDEIRRSGARTIMEALRLAPGLIVREQTVGNYDIHVRGLDNVPPNTQLHDMASSTLLVMVDYRVVYNYFQGGTFWETIPVGLHDVERIEIIRGPAAALYGPNAVTGVINIITARPKKKGFYTSNRVEYGPLWDERLVGAAAGYDFGPLSLIVSGDYHHADRHDSGYFSFRDRVVYEDPADMPRGMSGAPLENPVQRYPRLDLATDRLAVNAFLNARLGEHGSLDISGGFETSRVQKIYADTWATPLTTNDSVTGYADVMAKLYGATAHVSYYLGDQAMLGNLKALAEGNVRAYRFNVLDSELTYDIGLLDEKLRITPGVGFRRAEYSGALIASHSFEDDQLLPGNLDISDPDKALQALSGSLRGDLKLFDKVRVVAGVRVDYYFDRVEDRFYPRTEENLDYTTAATAVSVEGKSAIPSWQIGATAQISPLQLLRLSYSRAHRAPFLINTYFYDDYSPPVIGLGNRALDVVTSDAVELGHRGQLLEGLEVDTELFYSNTRGFSGFYPHARELVDGQLRIYTQAETLDTVAHQIGLTLSAFLTLPKSRLKLFATVQETLLAHHAPDTLHLFDFEYDPQDPANQSKLRHRGTPSVYGGLTFDIRPIQKLNINANVYAYTGHTLARTDQVLGMLYTATYETSEYEVRPKAILNAKVAYTLVKGLDLFVSGYNLLFIKRPEHFHSDSTNLVAMVGAEYSY